MAKKKSNPEDQGGYESMDITSNDVSAEIGTSKPVKEKQKVKRLSNAEIVEKLNALKAEIEYERNLRGTLSNVINRENARQLDGVVQKLHANAFSFEMFTRPPKAI